MRWNSLHGHIRMHIITLTQSLESLPPPPPPRRPGFPICWKNNNPLKLWPLGQNIQEFQVTAGPLAQIAAVTYGLYFYTVKHCAPNIAPFTKSVKMPPEMVPVKDNLIFGTALIFTSVLQGGELHLWQSLSF